MRKLTTRERRRQKIMFPIAMDEDNIYRRCNASVKEKKNLIRELCYIGEEKHGEKREERQREIYRKRRDQS